jgi:pimeloyl-ACP methyl ester carboxylesterase
MSRPSWSPTATAASSPRRQRRASTPCAICCSCRATCLRSGRAFPRSAARKPAPFLDIDPEGGTFTVRPDALVETFLQDCDPEIQRQASGKTARQSLAILEQPVRAAAWQQLASTYLVCAEDRGTPADLQREFAGRAGSVVELDAGHHPFLSQPASVRDLVLSL